MKLVLTIDLVKIENRMKQCGGPREDMANDLEEYFSSTGSELKIVGEAKTAEEAVADLKEGLKVLPWQVRQIVEEMTDHLGQDIY